MVRKKKILYLQARNLGDAVMGTYIVEAIALTDGDIELSVLARPDHKSVYSYNPRIKSLYSSIFPMGHSKAFTLRRDIELLKLLLRLRAEKFDLVINSFGDFRENLISWIISPCRSVGPVFANAHPIRQNIRQGLSHLLGKKVAIPAETLNIYSVIKEICRTVEMDAPVRQTLYSPTGEVLSRQLTKSRVVGVHPSASDECRKWMPEKWGRLIDELVANACEVKIFGAPSDKAYIDHILTSVTAERVEVVTGSIDQFFARLQNLDVMVGLDSFSAHASYAIGVPLVMIEGGNDVRIWAPPKTRIVGNRQKPACHPCMGRPTCTSGPQPYSCIRGTSVDDVLGATLELLSSGWNLGTHRADGT